jgi:hypothetical protein
MNNKESKKKLADVLNMLEKDAKSSMAGYMDPTEYKISPYSRALFGAELGVCQEGRNGPSRHGADFVISNPRWKHPHAFCREHLENNAANEPALRFAWDTERKAATASVSLTAGSE